MAMQFLCSTHRQQLKRSRVVAENRWDEWMEAGREAFAQRDWQAALKYLGCSFELSEMLLNSEALPTLSNVDRYMVSGHFLAECFGRCHDRCLQRHCLLAVHHHLLKVLRSPQGRGLSLQRNVEISLQMLSRHYEAAGEEEMLQACYQESMRLLKHSYH
ncbi:MULTISPECIES: hypothetical protein [Zhongshania]|jgi:hypothetical protein|uniref:Uncharacterized protein n=1 Tax=Zhongshania marina TaxID=2304603 RepID=A0A2S4HH43_9GAMM|nr:MULTISPECIES: hypothetical protein [Spongiibacteraceae]POP53306.1 hypothetical protein C0068_07700 [Marortus luteolus]RNL65967.1 hypothetical protein D0911_06300 [Zhongshania marina]CAA0102313.1 Uncharacterised protein [Zhongshania aliphaticivorans]